MISYKYAEQKDVFLLSMDEIQTPIRNQGVSGYRTLDQYFKLKKSMLNCDIIEPIQIRSKEKTKTEKYMVYDGYHRFHLSVELGYSHIPVKFNDWDMNEFFKKEKSEVS